MKRFVFCFILSLGILITSATFAANEKESSLKIGVFDLQKIMKTSKAVKNAQAAYAKEVQLRRSKISANENEVRLLEEELQKNDAQLSDDDRREKSEKLAKAAKELKRLRSDIDEELKQKNSEFNKKIMEDIWDIVYGIFHKERYSLILERSTIVIADDSIDITDKIIRIYDARKK